jgi:hypothetical protein
LSSGEITSRQNSSYTSTFHADASLPPPPPPTPPLAVRADLIAVAIAAAAALVEIQQRFQRLYDERGVCG